MKRADRSRAVRLAMVLSLALACAPLPQAAAAVAAPTATCAFPARHPTLDRGAVLALEVSLANTGEAEATFTAVMRANDLFGAAHTVLTRTVGAGQGAEPNAHLATTAAPFGTAEVTVEITSSATGATVLGACTTRLTISPDTDGDGLLDAWETQGIDSDGDGVADLVPAGSDPRRRDIYLELDHMTAHALRPEARQDVVAAFANAPLANPDGSHGITLHIDEDEEIAHQDDLTTWAGYDAVKSASFGTAAQRQDPKALAAKRLAYHYVLFAHKHDNGTSSGRAEIHGDDVLVTLGADTWGLNDEGTHHVGSRRQQAGTLMHELGHNLGLLHGGDSDVNCKPNYISVMSYAFQTGYIPQVGGGRKLDYSTQALKPLEEPRLLEKDGVGDAGQNVTYWSSDGGAGGWSSGQANAGLDWDEDGSQDPEPVSVDVNNLGISGCGPSAGQTLTGYDDWQRLDLNFRDDADSSRGPHAPAPSELTGESASRIEDQIAAALAPRAEAGGPYLTQGKAAVTFQGSARDPDSAELAFAWDFGDGTGGTGATPSHTYAGEGTFTVTVTVTDSSGLSGKDSATVTVGGAVQAGSS
ncbi:PKD domain-containing protein [Nonomuraea dietziae]|uniref:PKD domain-containing protein n=1 Tax=Nonomuraea dietziae TaxID=65515 RepID=UPI00340E8BFD